MKLKEVSLAKTIMLGGLVVAILYSLYLGNENVTLAALGIIGGYLAKDIETRNDSTIAGVIEEAIENGDFSVEKIEPED